MYKHVGNKLPSPHSPEGPSITLNQEQSINRWERGWLQQSRDFAVSPTAFTARMCQRESACAGVTCLAYGYKRPSYGNVRTSGCCFQQLFLKSVLLDASYFISGTVISLAALPENVSFQENSTWKWLVTRHPTLSCQEQMTLGLIRCPMN